MIPIYEKITLVVNYYIYIIFLVFNLCTNITYQPYYKCDTQNFLKLQLMDTDLTLRTVHITAKL